MNAITGSSACGTRIGTSIVRRILEDGYKHRGPNTDVFLQITCDKSGDLLVPGQGSTFGVAKAGQARGDFQVLAEHGRRALRLHLDGDVQEGLTKLEHVVREAFGW